MGAGGPVGGCACGLAGLGRSQAWSCRGGRDAAWAARLDGRDAHKDLARVRGAGQPYFIRIDWRVLRETALYKNFYSKLLTGKDVTSQMRWLGPPVLAICIIAWIDSATACQDRSLLPVSNRAGLRSRCCRGGRDEARAARLDGIRSSMEQHTQLKYMRTHVWHGPPHSIHMELQ